MVVSTSTFAFNQLSSQYMKNTPGELADMILGLPRVSKELKKLEPYGYHVKGALSLIQSDNQTDSIVYTSRRFQPFADSFSDHYAFIGPSVFSKAVPNKTKERPLLYISMGTVINDRPDFYRNCIEALRDTDNDVIISCGNTVDIKELGELPENVSVYSYVDQMDVLGRANVFVTHCGMNSVSESMYMATPMVLNPQTNEQKAVARRAEELGAGKLLRDESAEGIRAAVLEILRDTGYFKAAEECRKDFLSCPGTTGAADFIESAPHESDGKDIIKELNRSNTRFTTVYTLAYIAVLVALKLIFGWKHLWIAGVIMGILGTPIGNVTQNRRYRKILEKHASGN
jgi:MGT family glycosyltransferase